MQDTHRSMRNYKHIDTPTCKHTYAELLASRHIELTLLMHLQIFSVSTLKPMKVPAHVQRRSAKCLHTPLRQLRANAQSLEKKVRSKAPQ